MPRNRTNRGDSKIMSILKVISAVILFCVLYELYKGPDPIPELPETWWGPGIEKNADINIRPFRITFSDKDIADLKSRLKNTRPQVSALEGTGWTYGIDGSYLPKIINYWLNEYNFKEREAHLNQYPQFITNIQGLDIHYIHAKPKNSAGKRVLPLLLQHGWPGSIVEFHKILPILTTPRDDYDFVFEVIAPSLPGFGFSSAAIKPGLGSPQIAVVLKNLMLRVGFEKFYTQGGDWGAITTESIAGFFPQHVLGVHSNMCSALTWKNYLKTIFYSIAPSLLLPAEHHHLMYPVKEKLLRKVEETGYLHIQATKPDTVGVGPSDSPAALAAYVLEKFSTATNPEFRFKQDGNLLKKFTVDELIDNLMLYWIPNTSTTAMRIYAETINRKNYGLATNIRITVPSACAQFPHEIVYQPSSMLKERYVNLQRATIMPRGGHFAALEEPELLANDVFASIDEFERIHEKAQMKDEKSNEL